VAGLYDTFVGQTTRYVVNKAPCRVILTAPPGEGAPQHHIIRSAPPATGDPVEVIPSNGGISDADAAAAGAAG